MARQVFSEKVDLIQKSREAMLAAVQIYNNPLITFKTESFTVLSTIAWTYLLHAYYRDKKIDYKYFSMQGTRKKCDLNTDKTVRYWDLKKCISVQDSPLDQDVTNNINFLIGLRNQVEHKKATGLDSYLSARYQASALNFNFYIKKLHGEKYALDQSLALSLQFSELDYNQFESTKKTEAKIPANIISYIANFDKQLSDDEIKSDRFAYRLLFTKVLAKREGQADRVIEFIDPKSEMAINIDKQYIVKVDTEKPKLSATQIIQKVQAAGFKSFGKHQHTLFWKKHDGKNPDKGFGTVVVKTWCWYQSWVDFIIGELGKNS